MTMIDDLHNQRANLAEQVGRERSRYDKLRLEHDNVLHDLRAALQANRDLLARIRQLQERLRGEDDRPMSRLEDDHVQR